MAGRGRDRVLPAWMASAGNGVPLPPGHPSTGSNWADVDQIATAAVLQEQDTDLRAALAQQRCSMSQEQVPEDSTQGPMSDEKIKCAIQVCRTITYNKRLYLSLLMSKSGTRLLTKSASSHAADRREILGRCKMPRPMTPTS